MSNTPETEVKRKKVKSKEVYSYKKGQILPLDAIYSIQGLCNGNWWEHVKGKKHEEDFETDTVKITRNITIEIIER